MIASNMPEKRRVEAEFVGLIRSATLPEVEGLEIWRDPEANRMFAVESSYLEQHDAEINSPYNSHYILVLDVLDEDATS